MLINTVSNFVTETRRKSVGNTVTKEMHLPVNRDKTLKGQGQGRSSLSEKKTSTNFKMHY